MDHRAATPRFQSAAGPIAASPVGHRSDFIRIGHLALTDRFANRLSVRNAAALRFELDDLFKANEHAARCGFEHIIGSMPFVEVPPAFERHLQRSVIPSLHGLGLDAELARDLFRVGAPAWRPLGPYLGRKIVAHPLMVSEMKRIRDVLRRNADKAAAAKRLMAEASDVQKRYMVDRAMHPENLGELIDRVSTPWIVMPRAYTDLSRRHGRYLPIYLHFIDRNGHAECNRVFLRLALELVANYAIKFGDYRFSSAPVRNAFFHAYESMFWRNLRHPPPGFENSCLFQAFLQILAALAVNSSNPPGNRMRKSLLRMQLAAELIFPDYRRRPGTYPPSRFTITLRHGIPGQEALLRYFSRLPGLYRSIRDRQRGEVELLKASADLVRDVRRNLCRENEHTKRNLRQFLSRLGRMYAKREIPGNGSSRLLRGDRFFELKMARWIEELGITATD